MNQSARKSQALKLLKVYIFMPRDKSHEHSFVDLHKYLTTDLLELTESTSDQLGPNSTLKLHMMYSIASA